MSSKRPRLEDSAAKIREMELELELAKLRSQNEVPREEVSCGAADEVQVEEPAKIPATHPGTTATTPAAATPATEPPPLTTTTSSSSHDVRGRGRGARGARGRSFSLDYRGLQTIFVCERCDKIYCQSCNHYEQTKSYWDRH